MSKNKGFLNGIFDNAEILFFILVFLLLFYGSKGSNDLECIEKKIL
jgi:hypothetical protein